MQEINPLSIIIQNLTFQLSWNNTEFIKKIGWIYSIVSSISGHMMMRVDDFKSTSASSTDKEQNEPLSACISEVSSRQTGPTGYCLNWKNTEASFSFRKWMTDCVSTNLSLIYINCLKTMSFKKKKKKKDSEYSLTEYISIIYKILVIVKSGHSSWHWYFVIKTVYNIKMGTKCTYSFNFMRLIF